MRRGLILVAMLAPAACQGNFPGLGSNSPSDTPLAASCVPTVNAAPLQRLNAAQYINSAKDLLNLTTVPALSLPTDDAVGPFAINTATVVTDLAASQYQTAAETLATLAVPQLMNASVVACATAAGAADPNCLDSFVGSFGARAFRRPLTADEVARYANLAAPYLAAQDANSALRIVVQGMLQSPHFLYRPEFGASGAASSGNTSLSSYELATRLSYFLWNTTPDTALQQAAAGNLQDASVLTGQVQRMIASPRFGASMGLFVQSLLGTTALTAMTKDPNVFPTYNATLVAAMAQETTDFTTFVMAQGDGRISTLLTAPYSVLSDPLFAYYGVTKPAGWTAGAQVPLSAAQRTGLLTQGAFLTEQAHFNATGVVARGKTLRENFLCQAMPPPPPNVPPLPANTAGHQTARQMFDTHVSSPSCASCHNLMDPMGLAFEHYDGIGQWRDTDGGLPIDPSGSLTGTPHSDGNFANATALAALLAGSTDVQACVATQMARFSLQREASGADACTVAKYTAALQSSQGDLRALARAIVTSPAFTQLGEN